MTDISPPTIDNGWLGSLFDKSPDAYLVADDTMGCVAANPAAARLTGYGPEELLGMRIRDLLPETDPRNGRPWVEDCIRSGPAAACASLHCRDATIRETHCRIVADITPGCHLVILTDIGEQRRMKRDCEQQLAFTRSLIESIGNPIFFKGTDGRYRGCNTAFADYLGLPKEEIIGRTVYEVASSNLAARYEEADRRLLEAPGVQKYEAQVR